MHDLRDLTDVYEQLVDLDDLPDYDDGPVHHQQWVYDLLDELLARVFDGRSKRRWVPNTNSCSVANIRSLFDLIDPDQAANARHGRR